jgi:alkylhydroperoxidase family enzyme
MQAVISFSRPQRAIVIDMHWKDLRAAGEVFSERELADPALAIVAFNGWNRLNMTLKANVYFYARH